jgi:monofunctional biosynthetic peptidoglycan transglycosylase
MRRFWLPALAAGALAAAASAAYLLAGLPARTDVHMLARKNPGTTALMRQREKEARRPLRPPTWVPLERVSHHLIHAVIASEDQAFFGHDGVDWTALRESVEKNVRRRRAARGGSTLTQQLAKNLYFGTDKTLTRKLRELVVSRWLEQDLTKPRILALYLNVIEWGDGVYGCEAAALAWYGKPAAALDEVEAAGLAAMIPNPRRINPRTGPAQHARAQERVLRLMARAGYLGRDAARLGAAPPAAEPVPEEAPGDELEEEDLLEDPPLEDIRLEDVSPEGLSPQVDRPPQP